jgi:tight adherence protein B
MHLLFFGFSLLIFIATAFAVEALWRWWFSTQSQAARRFSERIQAMGGAQSQSAYRVSLLKQRRLSDSHEVDQFLRKIPAAQTLDTQLQQAGSAINVSRLLAYCGTAMGIGLLFGLALSGNWLTASAIAISGALIPFALLNRQRTSRMQQIQQQLPEVADLIARSLRAGHALPATMHMVAEEMPEPIAGEFRQVADEINYGLGLQVAMQHLSQRIPIDDLRFLVVAVLIQRDTGGNLAELMQNMSHLIRERLKLLGQVSALSAEGRLSGWILFLMPVAMALLLSITNPDYLFRLIEDPLGRIALGIAVVQMLLGGLWMRTIVQLRV